jgi:micrococcal nuclease
MIEYIFFLIFFASLIGLVVGLIRPSLVKMKSRKSVSIILGSIIIVSFILLAITIPPSTQQSDQEQSKQEIVNTEIETKENTESEITPPENNNDATPQQTNTASTSTTVNKPATETPSIQTTTLYNVVKVVDGDTIDVSINGETKRLRLIGINTPETVDPRTAVQCFGKEASDKAKELLTGKKVSLEADSTQGELDKYSRLLRYVFLEDGTNFNLYMIKEGYAYEYTYNTPYKYQVEFKAAQVYAKTNNKGLWSPSTCNGELKAATQIQTTTTSQSSTTSTTFGACGTKTICSQMTSCEEAKYFLNTCGVTRLDGDSDGVPCQTTVCED